MRVLIVDDSPQVRRGLRELVGSVGAGDTAVSEADSVAAARSAIANGSPDVVVLDFYLRDGTALDVLRDMRRGGGAPMVVVLTNHVLSQYRKACLDAGANHFLDKSLALGELTCLLRAAAEGR